MSLGRLSQIFVLLLGLEVAKMPSESKMFHLDDALMRHAQRRCLQQYPQAETVNFTDSHETQCFLQCFLYKMGLMDLRTRGLASDKFIDIWENIGEAVSDDICLESFDFSEPLSGSCMATYRKLMQFRNTCFQFFEYTFALNNTWKTDNPEKSKPIGQSATQFCDLPESKKAAAIEDSEENDVSLMSQYKEKLKCIFDNIHYLDAYGRVDETEILLSFQEAFEDSVATRAAVSICVQRANSKYQQDCLGNTVVELQKCLKTLAPAFAKVFKLRDEASQQY